LARHAPDQDQQKQERHADHVSEIPVILPAQCAVEERETGQKDLDHDPGRKEPGHRHCSQPGPPNKR
jgi:hypothetical protein